MIQRRLREEKKEEKKEGSISAARDRGFDRLHVAPCHLRLSCRTGFGRKRRKGEKRAADSLPALMSFLLASASRPRLVYAGDEARTGRRKKKEGKKDDKARRPLRDIGLDQCVIKLRPYPEGKRGGKGRRKERLVAVLLRRRLTLAPQERCSVTPPRGSAPGRRRRGEKKRKKKGLSKPCAIEASFAAMTLWCSILTCAKERGRGEKGKEMRVQPCP